jgi:hypothetical protein
MKKPVMALIVLMVLAGTVSADAKDLQLDPVRENVVLRLDTGSRINDDDIQRIFTALTISYLKSNSSYILIHEIYRDRRRQDSRPSLVITELDYGTFSITNLRYSFSNGYFEFKLSLSPFTNVVNDELVYSIDYDGAVGRNLYKAINDKLQEAVYISRGYAAMYRKRSSASFYIFK